jgi:hypothetical protein
MVFQRSATPISHHLSCATYKLQYEVDYESMNMHAAERARFRASFGIGHYESAKRLFRG